MPLYPRGILTDTCPKRRAALKKAPGKNGSAGENRLCKRCTVGESGGAQAACAYTDLGQRTAFLKGTGADFTVFFRKAYLSQPSTGPEGPLANPGQALGEKDSGNIAVFRKSKVGNSRDSLRKHNFSAAACPGDDDISVHHRQACAFRSALPFPAHRAQFPLFVPPSPSFPEKGSSPRRLRLPIPESPAEPPVPERCIHRPVCPGYGLPSPEAPFF